MEREIIKDKKGKSHFRKMEIRQKMKKIAKNINNGRNAMQTDEIKLV